ncbi:MAG TPA: heparan-alpha-glucosaminide N-acetyltransferase domain-containing protein [Gemmatimonadaceae bacterium]|nr:heparan-alpha-glucosaminide N-acetyltransferase domain-containing protein [Gemmatimonadaceae bacterium]
MTTPPPVASGTASFTPDLSPHSTVRPTVSRIASVDVLRGIAVVLMAIDHVRVYAGVPAGGPTPGLFFTRWITHFVAPVFVFLAGTAAFLHGQKLGSKKALARFLLMRGVLLIALELTVIRFFWTFNFDFANYILLGVIWVIGWSMIALAALVFLPTAVVGALALVMIFGHNLADIFIRPGLESLQGSLAWSVGYFAFEVGDTGPLAVLYSLVPWIGVMAAGYAFGAVLSLDSAKRRRVCLFIGGGAIALFFVLRAINGYGDPRPWEGDTSQGWWPVVRSFLNTSKYPASLIFLLMTLGPAIALLPFLERPRTGLTRALETFGRVPMFYYLLHIPLIHLLAMGVSLARTGAVEPWLFGNHPLWVGPPPEGYQWSLWLLYLVTGIAVAMLYVACRWYAKVKATSPHPLLRYI